MLNLYVPGTGVLHRSPAGLKICLLVAIILGVSFLPSTWWASAVAAGIGIICYAAAGLGDGTLGMRSLLRHVLAARWLIVFMAVSQLIFMGPEPALANTARVTVAVVIAALLTLTTPVTALLDALERGMEPLRRIGVSPERVAILLTVTLTTVPVLARLARHVREAQRARGGRASLRAFAVPFLIVALKHADELGDALAARGVR